jgi:caa(3)-type oxidase subunit IV
LVDGPGHSIGGRGIGAADFSVAIVKAFLVARHYMHLRHERAVIYAIALVPLVFVVIFLIGLFPDFVYHPTKP